jgi:hypothetical protein
VKKSIGSLLLVSSGLSSTPNGWQIQSWSRRRRMCIDYTNLNSACPKEEFVLPWIDQIIDSTAGLESLFFLDAYSSYNQIKIT